MLSALTYLEKIDMHLGKGAENMPAWVLDLEKEILAKIPNYRFDPAALTQSIRERAKPYVLEKVATNERFEVILD